MPFYNGYPGGYYTPPMNPPMPDQLAQLRQGYPMQPTVASMQQPVASQPPQTAPIIWVQGEEGAKAYMVAAGNSVLLMDSENSTFYLKSSDQSGMPLPLRIFDYSERTQTAKTPVQAAQTPNVEYVTRAEFDALAAKLNALTQGGKEDGQSAV
jgi:hypothetical protein